VGECASAEEAFPQVGELSPDVVLMDIQMSGWDGIKATRYLREGVHCDAAVIMLAENADHLIEALEAGAAGYLLKDIKRAELAQVIRQVYQNEHPPEKSDGFVEETVELVIPPPVDAAQTLGFIDQVERRLQASILQTVGSWDWGTVITIQLKPDPLSNLPDKLRNMPDVEEVEEEPLARDALSKLLGKLGGAAKLKTSPSKRILITLK